MWVCVAIAAFRERDAGEARFAAGLGRSMALFAGDLRM